MEQKEVNEGATEGIHSALIDFGDAFAIQQGVGKGTTEGTTRRTVSLLWLGGWNYLFCDGFEG